MFGGLKTKANKNRSIPISEEIYKFIESAYNPASEFLIAGKNRRPIGIL
ncbi:MAG: hypothetical protein H6Q70_2013 [Firmicutes bacterium]|nr:hypothetical protein [Bacillota bacterium]